MISIKVASRYADALFDLARENNKINEYSGELKSLRDFFAENADLCACMQHPEISFKDKASLLNRLLEGHISKDIVSTLLLLIKKGHEPNAQVLYDLFYKRTLEYERKIVAQVSSPYPLSDNEKNNLASAIKNYVGKDVLLETNVDESIIAGLIITVQGRVIDGSAKSILERIKSSAKA